MLAQWANVCEMCVCVEFECLFSLVLRSIMSMILARVYLSTFLLVLYKFGLLPHLDDW